MIIFAPPRFSNLSYEGVTKKAIESGAGKGTRSKKSGQSIYWGERLIWEDYDAPSEQLLYRGDRRVCATCALAGTCPKQFEYPVESNETFWGMVPSHTRVARRILRRFRPRVEPGFNRAKNKYCITDFFLNSRHLARTLAILSDIVETPEILAQERPTHGRQTRKAILRDVFQLELWD